SMTARLDSDPELKERYVAATADYLARRHAIEVLGKAPAQGGTPDRVKCLHVLVAPSVAVGRGLKPQRDGPLDLLPRWGAAAPGAQRIRMVATSASRDADNSELFRSMVVDVLGAEPEVVTGDEEAALSFVGATRALDPADGPFLVMDIGGGSTELVLGTEA